MQRYNILLEMKCFFDKKNITYKKDYKVLIIKDLEIKCNQNIYRV